VLVTRVSADDAIRIAQAEAERQGWPWTEPVSVTGRLLRYRVMTNTAKRGDNVNVHIRIRDGTVRRAGFAPR
jgi:hypothetical protein